MRSVLLDRSRRRRGGAGIFVLLDPFSTPILSLFVDPSSNPARSLRFPSETYRRELDPFAAGGAREENSKERVQALIATRFSFRFGQTRSCDTCSFMFSRRYQGTRCQPARSGFSLTRRVRVLLWTAAFGARVLSGAPGTARKPQPVDCRPRLRAVSESAEATAGVVGIHEPRRQHCT